MRRKACTAWDGLAQVFAEWDADGDAKLDPMELSGLVSIIPGLERWEQGLILAVAAQLGDKDGDGCLSLNELLGVTQAFREKQRLVGMHQQPAGLLEQLAEQPQQLAY